MEGVVPYEAKGEKSVSSSVKKISFANCCQ